MKCKCKCVCIFLLPYEEMLRDVDLTYNVSIIGDCLCGKYLRIFKFSRPFIQIIVAVVMSERGAFKNKFLNNIVENALKIQDYAKSLIDKQLCLTEVTEEENQTTEVGDEILKTPLMAKAVRTITAVKRFVSRISS